MMDVTESGAIDDALCAALRRDERRRRGVFAVAGAAAAVAVLASICLGAVRIPPSEILSIMTGNFFSGQPDGLNDLVLVSIRLPRACLAVLIGGGLAVAGASTQGLFRNPLADPGLIGISTGAALVAAALIVLGDALWAGLAPWRPMLLPAGAFLGGIGATWLVYRVAHHDGRVDVATMLLAGVALNAGSGAVLGLLIFFSNDQALRDLNFWLLGSLGGANWSGVLIASPLILLPTLATHRLARPLNGLLFGETEALHLGFSVERTKRIAVAANALAVGTAVALTGVIGFVGLVVPHLGRLLIGPDHRFLLPLAFVLGAGLLSLADLLARTLVLPAELPIGILTSLIGAPFFLWMLLRQRARAG